MYIIVIKKLLAITLNNAKLLITIVQNWNRKSNTKIIHTLLNFTLKTSKGIIKHLIIVDKNDNIKGLINICNMFCIILNTIRKQINIIVSFLLNFRFPHIASQTRKLFAMKNIKAIT